MRKLWFSSLVTLILSSFLVLTPAAAQEGDGLKLNLNKGTQIQIEGLSKSGLDRCFIEYVSLSASGTKEKLAKSKPEKLATFVLRHKREKFDDHALEIDRLTGKVGQVLGGTWKRKLMKKGQILSSTEYDAYGKPVKTIRTPIEAVLITVKLRVIDIGDSRTTVLVLPDSKITSIKE